MSNADQVTVVGSTTFTLVEDSDVLITRRFNAERPLVFDVWTNPIHLPNWMTGPSGWSMVVCDIDLRPGGNYRYVWRRPDESEIEIRGVYLEILRPERIVTNESWGAKWPDTHDTLVLSEENGQTIALMTIHYPTKKDRGAALETGMKKGLAESYDNLANYLEGLGKIKPRG